MELCADLTSIVQGNDLEINRMCEVGVARHGVWQLVLYVVERMASLGILRTSYRSKVVSEARMGLRLGYLRDRKRSAKRSHNGKASNEMKG